MSINLLFISKIILLTGLFFILSPDKAGRFLLKLNIGKKYVYDEMEEEKLGGARLKTERIRAFGIGFIFLSVLIDVIMAMIFAY